MGKHPLRFAFLIVLIIFTAEGLVHASTIFVPDDYQSIQLAIDMASNGDTIIVRDGTYTGPNNRGIRLLGKAIALMSENGPENCVIDCEEQSKGIFIQNHEGNTTIIDGFTIINGESGMYGSGIYVINSSPIIQNCIIRDCHSRSNGGGLVLDSSYAEVTNCTFINNSAELYGGGIYLEDSEPVILNCIINRNSAQKGGGVYIETSVYMNPVIANCLIDRNSSLQHGAGVYIEHSIAELTNCTIVGNAAGDDGGGLALYTHTSPEVSNTIIWGNSPNELYLGSGSVPHITYSLISGSFTGVGNMGGDPLFYSGDKGEYYLSNDQCGQNITSPCVNKGEHPASDECYPLAWHEICLNSMTTRTDHRTDQDQVDIGFHYSLPNSQPTPTPTPPCSETGVTLEMPGNYFAPGDMCYLTATLCNNSLETLEHHALMVALEVDGLFWLAPSWMPSTQGLNYYRLDIEPGETMIPIINEFVWPDITNPGINIWFWAGMLSPDTKTLIGSMDGWTVSF